MKRLLWIGLWSIMVAVLLCGGAQAVNTNNTNALYICNTTPQTGGITTLYQVIMDAATGNAVLTPLPDAGLGGPGIIPFTNAGSIAATPDGKRIYAIEKLTGQFGYYDLSASSWVSLPPINPNPQGVVAAGFSPNGTLYAACDFGGLPSKVYQVDPDTGAVTELGTIVDQETGITVILDGADLAFGYDGSFYVFTNKLTSRGNGALRGLYRLTLPPVIPAPPATPYLNAEFLGSSTTGYVTGLAVLASGLGDLVALNNRNLDPKNCLRVLDKDTALPVGAPWDLYLDGAPFVHVVGDMTTGPLVPCTKFIAHWKNQSWNGAVVTICGTVIDETLGKQILNGANNDNWSKFFAELIALKLSTANASGIDVITLAEAFVCPLGIVNSGPNWWTTMFASKDLKKTATTYWQALHLFNEQHKCD